MKHLLLSCLRAKEVFQGLNQQLMPIVDGLQHWRFDHIFDPEAFMIVIKIIHSQSNGIPQEVSLEMLTKITTIVGYLHCQDTVRFFVELWLKKFDEEEEKDDSANYWETNTYSVSHIFIALVFNFEDRFYNATGHTARYCRGNISSCGLPICPRVLGKHIQLLTITILKS